MKIYWRDDIMTLITENARVDIARVVLGPSSYTGGAWVALAMRPYDTKVLTETFGYADSPGNYGRRNQVFSFVLLLDHLVEEGYLTEEEADEAALAHPVTDGWTCRIHPRWMLEYEDYCRLCDEEGFYDSYEEEGDETEN